MAELRVDANLDVLSSVGAFVMDAAQQAGLNSRTAYRLRLAVDEIATNVIVHGKPREHGDNGQIRVLAEIDEKNLKITLEDRGPEFDPLQRAAPREELQKPLEQRPIGGLGVFLARRGVDELLYERVGDTNRTTFVVNRHASASPL